MDDPNYKLKTIYSPVSPDEITLRCKILDLLQKLKRTEVLCDYYEQCRNELVSDCIRLRQERDYYLMAHRNNLQQRSEASRSKGKPINNQLSGPPPPPTIDNQLNQPKIQPSFQFEKEIDFSQSSQPDENYEEIAKRLISQFREEMEEIRRASMNGSKVGHELAQGSSTSVSENRVSNNNNINPNDNTSTMPTLLAAQSTSSGRMQSRQQQGAALDYNEEGVNNNDGISTGNQNRSVDGPIGVRSNVLKTSPFSKQRQSEPVSSFNPTLIDYEDKNVIFDGRDETQRPLAGGQSTKPHQSNQIGSTIKREPIETCERLSFYDGSPTSAYHHHTPHPASHQHQQSSSSSKIPYPRGLNPNKSSSHHLNRQRTVNYGSNDPRRETMRNSNSRESSTPMNKLNSNRENHHANNNNHHPHNNNTVNNQSSSEGNVNQPTNQGSSTATPTQANSPETEQYIDLCNELLKSSINDFDTLTRMLMNQNEKLRKLKGKQLRSYFKRQLDQNNETPPPPPPPPTTTPTNLPKRP